MALTDEVKRRIFLYFGVPQVNAASGGSASNLIVSPGTDKLVTALDNLTASGEATVAALLAILDAKWADLIAVGDSLLVRKAGPIELRGDEFDARRGVFNYAGSYAAVAYLYGLLQSNGQAPSGRVQKPYRAASASSNGSVGRPHRPH